MRVSCVEQYGRTYPALLEEELSGQLISLANIDPTLNISVTANVDFPTGGFADDL
jgi:hypothetical protein